MNLTVNWAHVVLLAINCAVLHWLVARSEIMRWFWSRLRRDSIIDKLLRCPACSGFWLGLGSGIAGLRPLEGIPTFGAVYGCGLLAVFLTPVTEAVMLWGLEQSAIENAENLAEESAATPPNLPPH